MWLICIVFYEQSNLTTHFIFMPGQKIQFRMVALVIQISIPIIIKEVRVLTRYICTYIFGHFFIQNEGCTILHMFTSSWYPDKVRACAKTWHKLNECSSLSDDLAWDFMQKIKKGAFQNYSATWLVSILQCNLTYFGLFKKNIWLCTPPNNWDVGKCRPQINKTRWKNWYHHHFLLSNFIETNHGRNQAMMQFLLI